MKNRLKINNLPKRFAGRLAGVLGLLLALCLISSIGITPALAIPQISQQFYGNVTIGGNPAPDDTSVTVEIDGVQYAATTTAGGTYGEAAVFIVPADDPDTEAIEGGVPGDTVQFFVGTYAAATAIFQSGAITEKNLNVPALTVTINQAAGQLDPADTAPVHFTVIFNSPVADFAAEDVVFTGSTVHGTLAATITGGPATYDVTVNGMTTDFNGDIVALIPAAGAHDGTGNANTASTSVDNTVYWDPTDPIATIDQAAGQADPTNASPINFTVEWNEPVLGFGDAPGDVSFAGSTTPGTLVGTVTDTGNNTFNVAVTGMTDGDNVITSIPAGVCVDPIGEPNLASTSTDNTVTYDFTVPTVTINQAAGQADPTGGSPVHFTANFSEPINGFAGDDVILGGTALPTTATVTDSGNGQDYDVAVTGMTVTGTVTVNIDAGAANDLAGNPSAAATSTDNSVNFNADAAGPTVTINQAAGQADPTNVSPINFTAVFNEPVNDFGTGDVTITGTAGGTKTATVTGAGQNYNVAVTGMTTAGTVIASIAANKAHDGAGNANLASTSTDSTVTWEPGLPGRPSQRAPNIVFRWRQVAGATSYWLEVNTKRDFTGTSLCNQDVGNVFGKTVTGLTFGTTVYWRVKAKNASGYGPWSYIRSVLCK